MNIPQLVKEEVQKIDPLSEVILFGSRARGEHKELSDWDFLILLNVRLTKDLKDSIWEKLYNLELNTGSVISSIIHSKSDWENRAVTPLYKIIAQEGVKA